jgi:hypothetical protein
MLPDSQLLFPRPSADEILVQLPDFFYTDELQAQVNAELEQRKRVVDVLEEKGRTGDLALEDIADVLQFSDHGLNAIISILGISQERFLGIITLKTLGGKPPGQSLGKDVVLSRIRQDRQFALELAQLFLHGQNDAELLGRFPPFELAKLDKQKLLLKHKALVDSLLRIGLKGRYDAKKGAILEKQIAYFLDRTCVQYTQGEISLFGISRKMDFVVPNIDSPFLLVRGHIE